MLIKPKPIYFRRYSSPFSNIKHLVRSCQHVLSMFCNQPSLILVTKVVSLFNANKTKASLFKVPNYNMDKPENITWKHNLVWFRWESGYTMTINIKPYAISIFLVYQCFPWCFPIWILEDIQVFWKI